MPEFCEKQTSPYIKAYNAWLVTQTHLKYGFGAVAVLSWMLGLVLIFIWHRKQAKSRFIWILWALISMVNAILIAELTYSILQEKANDRGDFDSYMYYYKHFYHLRSANKYFLSVTHWVFAMQYFQVIFKFPLIIAPQQDNIKAKQRRLRCTIWVANASYYSFMVLWFFLNRFYSDQLQAQLVLQIGFKVVFQVSPAALMIFAIFKLRRSIKDLRSFSMKEKLMCIHTVLFVCSIAANVASITSYIIWNKTNGQWTELCRAAVSRSELSDIAQVTNIVILWLITFMSIQLIKPLTIEWQGSVNRDLVDELDGVLYSADTEAAARASRMRLHSSALEDANRQIRFIQALINKTEGNSESEEESLHESMISITSAELRILADTNSDNAGNSSELFDRVKREEAQKLDRSDVSVNMESGSLLSDED